MDTRMIFAIMTLPVLAYIAYYVGLELWCYAYGLLY